MGRPLQLGVFASSLTSLICLAAAAEPPAQHELTGAQHRLLDRSIQAEQRGDLDDALAAVQEAIALGDRPELQLRWGELLLDKGACAEAREHLLRAESPDPWAMPGKDSHERARHAALHRLRTTCAGWLELTCEARWTPALDGRPVRCGERLEVSPGIHVLTASDGQGGESVPRRIQIEGAELATLRLDPPPDPGGLAAWTPSSPQPIPDQDPEATRREELWVLKVALYSLSGVFFALSGVSWLIYSDLRDEEPLPPDDPARDDPDFMELEERRVGAVTLGVGTSVVGAVLFALVFFGLDDDPAAPSAGPDAAGLSPWFNGEAGGLLLRF